MRITNAQRLEKVLLRAKGGDPANWRPPGDEKGDFWPANPWRRREFQIHKRVEQRGSRKVFVRTASTAAANAFLAGIVEKEQLAAREFGDKIGIVAGTFDGEELVHPFIEAPTLEDRIRESLLSAGGDLGLTLTREYARLLLDLPRVNCVPHEFYRLIGYPGAVHEPALSCLTFGPLDCIPQNIMVADSGWRLIDCEWTFPFPVPVEFVLWRGIGSLVQGQQDVIQNRCAPDNPLLLYGGYGLCRVYFPLVWFKELGLERVDAKRSARWDYLFQNTVLIGLQEKAPRLSARPRVYQATPGPWAVEIILEEQLRRVWHMMQTSKAIVRAKLRKRHTFG